MYTKIFMTGDGNNLIDILGCLNSMKQVSKAVVWTSAGAASLIVFLRSLGMNFTQIRVYSKFSLRWKYRTIQYHEGGNR